jgi:hypothetical protein
MMVRKYSIMVRNVIMMFMIIKSIMIGSPIIINNLHLIMSIILKGFFHNHQMIPSFKMTYLLNKICEIIKISSLNSKYEVNRKNQISFRIFYGNVLIKERLYF